MPGDGGGCERHRPYLNSLETSGSYCSYLKQLKSEHPIYLLKHLSDPLIVPPRNELKYEGHLWLTRGNGPSISLVHSLPCSPASPVLGSEVIVRISSKSNLKKYPIISSI